MLANSLVISKLDYCNSLLNGLPKSSINRLQVVQNSQARTIYPSTKRSDHISPVLHRLHWLTVNSRIEFKMATLTFKVRKFQQPAYIYDLIAPYIPPRSLRSTNKNLIIVPDIRSEIGCMMNFLCFTFHLEILSLNISALQIHYRTSVVYSRPTYIQKWRPTIVINRLHNVYSDFDLRTHSVNPLFHAYPTSLHSGRMTWLHGRDAPDSLHMKTKRALNSLLLHYYYACLKTQ